MAPSPILPALRISPTPSTAHGLAPNPHSLTSQDWYKYPTPTRALALSQGTNSKAKGAILETLGLGAGTRESKVMGEWRVGEAVGKGSSGRVRIARHTVTGEWSCIKVIEKPGVDSKYPHSIDREIIVMKLAEHPSVVRLIDVFESPTHLYLVTEFCSHGELYHYVVDHKLSSSTTRRFFSQLISALHHLHSLSLSHRDIKFENLLLLKSPSGSLTLKLADYGMSTFQPPNTLLSTSCGSPHYASPQIVAGELYAGPGADVWSAGVVLYAMLVGRLPFDSENVPQLLSAIVHGRYEIPREVRGSSRDLVERMLCVDTSRRITIDEIIKHPYLRSHPVDIDSTLPYGLIPGSFDLVPRTREELDDGVLDNLRIVMRVDDVEDVVHSLLCKDDTTRTKVFYSILANFKSRPSHSPSRPLASDPVIPVPRKRFSAAPLARIVKRTSSHRRSVSLPVVLGLREESEPLVPVTPSSPPSAFTTFGTPTKPVRSGSGPRLSPVSQRTTSSTTSPSPLGKTLRSFPPIPPRPRLSVSQENRRPPDEEDVTTVPRPIVKKFSVQRLKGIFTSRDKDKERDKENVRVMDPRREGGDARKEDGNHQLTPLPMSPRSPTFGHSFRPGPESRIDVVTPTKQGVRAIGHSPSTPSPTYLLPHSPAPFPISPSPSPTASPLAKRRPHPLNLVPTLAHTQARSLQTPASASTTTPSTGTSFFLRTPVLEQGMFSPPSTADPCDVRSPLFSESHSRSPDGQSPSPYYHTRPYSTQETDETRRALEDENRGLKELLYARETELEMLREEVMRRFQVDSNEGGVARRTSFELDQ